jgi:hypothetical protein
MAKGRGRRGVGERLDGLVEAGDHAAARAEARRVAGDPAASEEDRQAAAGLLRSLQPDGGAVGVGLSGLALALAVTAWLLIP